MNAKELAEKLNGTEYPFDRNVADGLIDLAESSGLVIVYGASDDLMEADGAIVDEFGCYEGGTALFDTVGFLAEGFDSSSAKAITANWDVDGYSWTYTTDIPHETFDILEDGEKYCRGIVFHIDDLAEKGVNQ